MKSVLLLLTTFLCSFLILSPSDGFCYSSNEKLPFSTTDNFGQQYQIRLMSSKIKKDCHAERWYEIAPKEINSTDISFFSCDIDISALHPYCTPTNAYLVSNQAECDGSAFTLTESYSNKTLSVSGQSLGYCNQVKIQFIVITDDLPVFIVPDNIAPTPNNVTKSDIAIHLHNGSTTVVDNGEETPSPISSVSYYGYYNPTLFSDPNSCLHILATHETCSTLGNIELLTNEGVSLSNFSFSSPSNGIEPSLLPPTSDAVIENLTANSYSFIMGNTSYNVAILAPETGCSSAVDDYPQRLILTEEIPTKVHKAKAVIISSGIVTAGKHVDLKAGESILLEAGFSVEVGAKFSANIETMK